MIGKLLKQKKGSSDSAQIVSGPRSDFFDVASASFESVRTNYNSFAREKLLQEERQRRDKLFAELSGKELTAELSPNYDASKLDRLEGLPRDTVERRTQIIEQFKNEAVQKFRSENPEKFASVPLADEMLENAKKRANDAALRAQKVASRAGGVEATLGSLVGGLGAAATDPINIMSLPFGAGASSSILKTIAVEAGINMGAEAVVQPMVADWQKELGKQYGMGEALENIAIAGAFGGGLAGVIKGARPSAQFAFRKIRELKNIPAIGKKAALDLERTAHIKELNPVTTRGVEGTRAHVESIEQVIEAIQNGKKLSDVELSVRQADIDLEVQKLRSNRSKLNPVQKGVLDELSKFTQDVDNVIERKVRSFDELTTKAVKKERKKFRQLIRESDLGSDELLSDIEQGTLKRFNKNTGNGEIALPNGETLKVSRKNFLGDKPQQGDIVSFSRSKKDPTKRAGAAKTVDQTIADYKTQAKPRAETTLSKKASSSKTQPVAPKIEPSVARDFVNEMIAFDSEAPRVARQKEILQTRNSPEAIKAETRAFEDLLDENPDLKITLEDGTELNVKALSDQFTEDQSLLSAISNCAIGGSL